MVGGCGRRRGGGPSLRLYRCPEIELEDLASIVGRRNAARILVQELRDDRSRILAMIEKGSRVEPCIHTAEVEEVVDKGQIVKRLLVDGRLVEDW